jgi:protein-L-isoaspartate O-methyltransferase
MTVLPADTIKRAAQSPAVLLATFVAAIFLSAALLFQIEPMFTKMVLPRLGGSPSVWSVAMVFFQTMLLAGYAYAHVLTRFVPGRPSIVIHLAVMALAVTSLPLAIGTGRPPADGEALWLIGLFTTSIGLPFFALAANGPLLQAWFARTGHPAARDPYFLYAASNVGSFLALLSYPTLVEPFIPLSVQTTLWSITFTLLIALIAASGILLWRAPLSAAAADAPTAVGPTAAAPGWRDGLIWCALAAIPAALLIAVTAHISTDVAAVPLLWVVPLALYLLTFVIVFQRAPLIPHALAVWLQPAFILVLIAALVLDPGRILAVLGLTIDPIKLMIGIIGLHCAVFFVNALVCHGELARRRPAARHLTVFYLWMAAGGMIGGIAAGLIAPHVFDWVAEYPILIVLAALCRPGFTLPNDARGRYLVLGVIAVTVLFMAAFHQLHPDYEENLFYWIIGSLLAASMVFWRVPLPFAALVAVALFINRTYVDVNGTTSVRSFFGVHRVADSDDGRFRILSHGTTLHGAERIRDASGQPLSGRPDILMYYYDGSAMAQVMDAVRARDAGPISYAVVGLGAGSLACRAKPADTVHYYEIDPAIVHIARDSGLFHFLSACRPNVPIMLGDARLTLADAPDGAYDIIYVDAFTSDAIPIHLITREAMAVYLRKLKPHGIVVIHVSNRFLELASVVTGIAAASGAVARVNDGSDFTEKVDEYLFVGTVVAVTRNDLDFGALAWSNYWVRQTPDPSQWVWTDDYSNIVGAILRQLKATSPEEDKP